jgi:poly-gamma-glutamate synthesis protein (capsule biosynthesis protein)
VPRNVLVRSARVSRLDKERVIRKGIALLAACLLLIAVLLWRIVGSDRRKSPVQLRGTGETLVIAATGDWFTQAPAPSGITDRRFAGVVDAIKSASIGLTTLEENLLDEKNIPEAEAPGTIRWPYGTKRQAEDLRRVGITVVSLANNHAADYGVEGMKQTQKILDDQGLRHAGSGADLAVAQAPVILGAAPRRVAVFAITTSASPESRATRSRGEILGRPGANALRYSPDVTVDPETFATLQHSPIATMSAERGQLIISGAIIKKGRKTSVELAPNEQDMHDILDQIQLVRSQSDVVVVMLHSHEPRNQSDVPAEFVQSFAHALIDAGASLVVGSGPHQLRGIEVYKSGAIFYSLGNFAFDYTAVDPHAADVYEAGADLYQLAMGALGSMGSFRVPQTDEPIWWQSVIAVTTIERGALKSIRLQPIDLGVDLPAAQRGVPRIASPEHAGDILQTLARLSQNFGTEISVQDGLGDVRLNK